MAAQQQQLQQFKDEMQKRDAALEQARTKADQAASEASKQQQTVSDVSSDMADLKQNVTNVALGLQETQKSMEARWRCISRGSRSPRAGFMAAETCVAFACHGLGHQHAVQLGAVLRAPAQAHISEFFGSGRQSRVSLLAQGRLGSPPSPVTWKRISFPPALPRTTTRATAIRLRQRQAWGQAALDSGWTFTGGQMWSLVTETKKGVENRSEATADGD